MDVLPLKTGIAEIDRQHGQLREYLDEFLVFANGAFEFSAMFTALQRLLEYTDWHFAYEEQLLSSWGYPQHECHSTEHRALTDKVRELWRRFEAGEALEADVVIKMITEWIIGHINEEDAEYAEFARSQGLVD